MGNAAEIFDNRIALILSQARGPMPASGADTLRQPQHFSILPCQALNSLAFSVLGSPARNIPCRTRLRVVSAPEFFRYATATRPMDRGGVFLKSLCAAKPFSWGYHLR